MTYRIVAAPVTHFSALRLRSASDTLSWTVARRYIWVSLLLYGRAIYPVVRRATSPESALWLWVRARSTFILRHWRK